MGRQGTFIVFEGIDGAGTTTQAQRLVASLETGGIPACFTCEPSTEPPGVLIRDILAGDDEVQPETLALLFAADRREHLFHPLRGIQSLITKGTTVVCDRYVFSSYAYQGVTTGIDLVVALNHDFPMPDHLFFIDTSPDESDRRLQTRPRRDRFETLSLQRDVAERYRDVMDHFENTVTLHRIDGNNDADTVFATICHALSSDFPELCR